MAHYIEMVGRLLPLILGFIFAKTYTICRHVEPCPTGQDPSSYFMQRCVFIVHTCLKYTSTGFQLFVSNHTFRCCNWFPGAVSLAACWASVFFQVYHSSKFISKSVTLQQVYCPSQWIVPWCSWADRLTLSRSDNAAPPCTICTKATSGHRM